MSLWNSHDCFRGKEARIQAMYYSNGKFTRGGTDRGDTSDWCF